MSISESLSELLLTERRPLAASASSYARFKLLLPTAEEAGVVKKDSLRSAGKGVGFRPAEETGAVKEDSFCLLTLFEGDSSASRDRPTSLSSSLSLLLPLSRFAHMELTLLLLRSSKNTSKNAYESARPIDSSLLI